MSARSAWTVGVAGVLGTLFIAGGLAWDAPGGECAVYGTSRDVQQSVRICVEYAADLSWLPPVLVFAGITLLVAALALALARVGSTGH